MTNPTNAAPIALEAKTRARITGIRISCAFGDTPRYAHIAAVASDADLCSALAFAREDHDTGAELLEHALQLDVSIKVIL